MLFDSAFNTSFGNQVLCYAWLSTAVLLDLCLPACLHSPCCDDECYWCTSCCVKGERESILIHFFFSISLRILLCVHFLCILLAAPPKPLNNKKKHPWKEKSACFFSMDWIELC